MIRRTVVAALRTFPRIAAALAISVVIITCSVREPLLQSPRVERGAALDARRASHPCETPLPSCYLASTRGE